MAKRRGAAGGGSRDQAGSSKAGAAAGASSSAKATTSKSTTTNVKKKPKPRPVSSSDDDDSDFEPVAKTPKAAPKKAAKAANKAVKTSSSKNKSNPPAAAAASTSKKKSKDKSAEKDPESHIHLPDLNHNVKRPRLSNVLDLMTGFALGRRSSLEVEKGIARSSVKDHLSQLRVYKTVSPFSRRVTAMTWHPSEPNVCAVGSKGGGVVVWNYNRDEFEASLDTDHAGGSIQHIMFDRHDPRKIYTCSIDGTFMSRVFRQGGGTQDHLAQKFLDTGPDCYDNWYTSFDISFVGKTMLAGGNHGHVSLMTQDGREHIWRHKLHKAKVSYIAFSPREPWLFVTASIDHTVKVWDIRKLQGCGKAKPNCLQSLEHDKAVNCAEFSKVDGARLLTTDQHSQLRIYRSPHWILESVLPHPHRQFQHLTPVKAVWHPLVDLVVAGRYPDDAFPGTLPGELRTIDFIDADTGRMAYQLSEPGLNKIMSLNRFSNSGDALLSSAGLDILIWKQKPDDLEVEYKSNKEARFTVQEWPGYKPVSKTTTARSKKKA